MPNSNIKDKKKNNKGKKGSESPKRKLIPVVMMLTAGAVVSILSFCLHMELKRTLIATLVALVVFYFFGALFEKMLNLFEMQNQEAAYNEGEVIEKAAEETPEDAASEA